jgi:drug/metabolite transporter (DMT)-like permease
LIPQIDAGNYQSVVHSTSSGESRNTIRRNSGSDRTVGIKEGNLKITTLPVAFFTYTLQLSGGFMKKLLSAGPLLIIFAAFLWSLDGLLRRSLYVLPPLVIVFYEHLIGFLLLLPFLVGHLKTVKTMAPRTWGAMAWVTVLSSIIGTLCYTAALGKIHYIQFSVVVLLQQMQPVFVVLFAHIVLRERISKYFYLWLIAALAGAYFVSFPNLSVNWTTGSGTIIAALLAIGAAFSWGSSTAFSRYALLQIPSTLATGLRFGLAALVTGLILFASGGQRPFFMINESQIAALILIALTTGMVAMAIYYRGLQHAPAWASAICELTWPVSAVFIDYVGFHRSLTMTQWIGAAVLLASIINVSVMSRKTADTEVLT